MAISDKELLELKKIGDNIESAAQSLSQDLNEVGLSHKLRKKVRNIHLGKLQKNLQIMGELIPTNSLGKMTLHPDNSLDGLADKIYRKARWLTYYLCQLNHDNQRKKLASSKTLYRIILARVEEFQNLCAKEDELPEPAKKNKAEKNLS